MNYRVKLLRALTFLGGLYFFLEFVLPETFSLAWVGAPDVKITFGKYTQQISNGFIAVGAMAVGLGLINLLSIHGSKVAFLRKGWINSAALLIGLFAMMLITGQDWSGSSDVARETERLILLRNFAQAIVADEKENTEVPAVPVRNAALVKALDEEVRSVRESASTQLEALENGIRAEGDPTKHRIIVSANKDLQAALVHINVLRAAIASNPTVTTHHAELASAISQAAVAWRQILSTIYDQSLSKKLYNFFFQGIFSSLGTAMFSLLGFYIASAAYRAFRVRSTESALMIIAALIVMLGQIPFGIWIWEGFPALRLWILNTPSAGARRAIEIGAAVAGLVMAFRMWLSIESESFSERK